VSDENSPGWPAQEAPPPAPFDLVLSAPPAPGDRDTELDGTPGTLSFPAATGVTPQDAAPATRTLDLERRTHGPVRSTGVLDWVAFVLAFLVAPLGILTGIAALVVSSRRNGWTSGIARAAVAIGVVVSVVLGGGVFLLSNVQQQQAAHDAIVASSKSYCGQLKSTPGMLQSPTYDWPSVQSTIADSIVAMQTYEDSWTSLAKSAPVGVKVGTQGIATAAGAIIASVTNSRVLDDDSNVLQIQQAVSNSGIAAWVSAYCG
jgi:hypothetical protein